uniref:Uncharacterized protein n=1 Tax=Brassica oleracea TaxID=3712 RepID=A0A3P6C157_BRAOL|nr:unnamed protein product [Brassica oleracea]
MWMQDVDIVYGVVHERLVDHFIGGRDTSDGEHNHNLSFVDSCHKVGNDE